MQFLISTARKSDSSLKMTIDLELVNNSNYQKLWSYLSKCLLFQGSCDYTVSYFFWKLHFFFYTKYTFIYFLATSFIIHRTKRPPLFSVYLCRHLYFFHLFLFFLFFFLGDHLSPRQGCYPGNFLSSNRTSFYLETALILHLDTYSCYTFSFHKQHW